MGLKCLHTVHRRGYGWLGCVGLYVSFIALVVVLFVSDVVETMHIASTGAESLAGDSTLMMSFFLLAWGSALLGLAITGVLHDPPSYLAGLVLTVGVPLGLLGVFVAGTAWDFCFWAGSTVPRGVAWLLLGYALLSVRGEVAHRPHA